MDGMDVSGVSKAMPAWMMDMDQLMAPLDEVEVARVLGLLSSTLLEATDKLQILDHLDLDQKDLIPQAVYRLQWKLDNQLKANEVPEVALLLKIIIAQQVGYEALVHRTEKVRQRQKYDQKYCEEEDELVYYELLYLRVIARKQIKNMLAPAQPCLQAPSAWIVRKLFDAELFD
jgi:hypothetical protein